MKRKKQLFVVIALAITLYACHHHKQEQTSGKTASIVIKSAPLTSTLYYSGIIEPLKTMVVTSPADGVVEDMAFHFGDTVKPGQPLFTVTSDKFESDYKTALMQYIKSKTDFNNSEAQLHESEFLHKNQLISDDDFKSKQTNYYTSQLSMIQAKETLNAMLKQLDFKNLNLDDLRIENTDKIRQLLQAQGNKQILKITSPAEGVILLANKGDGAAGELKKVSKGDQVKQGDVLAIIGNVNGLTIHINVSEFNINQLKVGQKVEVTGSAFPDYTLQGQIAGLDRQGQSSQGGLPTFPVEIIVPTLTKEQQEIIHMGMSAKVAIATGGDTKITVPIQAVFQKDGQSFVTIEDQKSGKRHDVAVKTGQTTLDSVVIDSQLTEGDKIVFTD